MCPVRSVTYVSGRSQSLRQSDVPDGVLASVKVSASGLLFLVCSYAIRLQSRRGGGDVVSESRRNAAQPGSALSSGAAGPALPRSVRSAARRRLRRTAELLATSLNTTATVYGTDAEGEFVYGVYEIAEGAGICRQPSDQASVRRVHGGVTGAQGSTAGRHPGGRHPGICFNGCRAWLPCGSAQAAQANRDHARRLFDIVPHLLRRQRPSILSLPADDATIALLTRTLGRAAGWTCLTELKGAGASDRNAVIMSNQPNKVMLNIDGELQAIRPRTVFRGTVPQSGAQFMLIAQGGHDYSAVVGRSTASGSFAGKPDEADIIALVRGLLLEANPFKNRVVLINRDLRTVRSRMSDRSWDDIIPHEQARAELDFIAASIRDHEMLKAEGLSIKRGLLLSGPPGDGKSTAIECFVNDIAGGPESSSSRPSSTSAPSITSRRCWRLRWSSSRTSI